MTLGTSGTPSALSVYMYKGVIPDDRVSTVATASSKDMVFSISLNSYEIAPGNYYISVHAGATDASYRVLARTVKSELLPGTMVYGKVCPKQWLYHHVLVKPKIHQDVYYTVELLSGDAFVKLEERHSKYPLKLSMPYRHLEGNVSEPSLEHLRNHTSSAPINLCNAWCARKQGCHFYIGIKGGASCTEYRVGPLPIASLVVSSWL
jgi:hypothetical protein